MTNLFLSLLLLATTASFAGNVCSDEMNQLYSKTTARVSKQEVAALTSVINKLRVDYIRRLDVRDRSEQRTVQLRNIVSYVNSGRKTGYKISIASDGDETTVHYYVTLDGRMIFAKWDNQSPVNYWICEKKN